MMEKSVWRTSGHGSFPQGRRARNGIERVFLAGENERDFESLTKRLEEITGEIEQSHYFLIFLVRLELEELDLDEEDLDLVLGGVDLEDELLGEPLEIELIPLEMPL